MSKDYQIKQRLFAPYGEVVDYYYAYDIKNNCRFEGGFYYSSPAAALHEVPIDRISPWDLVKRKAVDNNPHNPW